VNARVPYRATTPGGFSIIEAFKIPLNSLRAVRLFAALSSSNAKPVMFGLQQRMQVGDERFNSDDIQRLYESNSYPRRRRVRKSR
jgi:hypothetical protein